MIKNPANRYALPKVIISEVDSQNILEFKIKYEKLARLDRFEVKAMHYDDGEIVFDEVLVNGGKLDVEYQDEHKTLLVKIEGKEYSIRGQKIGGKQRLLENRVSKSKVQLTIKDNIQTNVDGTARQKSTEREFIVRDNIKLYGQIVGREIKTTKEIYLTKRFLGYRSDLLFYYSFVDKFLIEAKVPALNRNGQIKYINNKIVYMEFWDDNFYISERLIYYFQFMVNDNLKNSDTYFKDYLNDSSTITNDLEKVKDVFSKLRHALLHFEYDFFEKLFNGEDVGFDLDIEFLNLLIENIDKLNIDAKKEFIADEKIKLFGEELALSKVYALYSSICVNRVGFNKFINSLIMVDGVENESLKSLFDDELKQKNPRLFEALGNKAYYVDIHSNRAYKSIYNEHKELVSKSSALSDGRKIHQANQDIAKLKDKMNEITKRNSLSRLEHKLRVAFGFLYGEYNDHRAFKNNFDTDIKARKFETLNSEQSKQYFSSTYQNRKPRTREKLEKVESLNLKTLIEDDRLLKFVLLMFLFMPQEVKGEFLGFIKKYYHDTKGIGEDTKDKELDVVEEMAISLKLKILGKNIRSLTLFKYALSSEVKYNSSSHHFYEEGNRHGRIYKKLGISHNQEEFNKSLTVPLFRYYSALFKLINDFEIYSLAKANPLVSNLNELVDNTSAYRQGGRYNFRTMLMAVYTLTNNELKDGEIVFIRNKIAHLDNEVLLSKPLTGKTKLELQRKNIINFMEDRGDMKEVLGYDAINDYRMKVVHLRTKMRVNGDKLIKMIKLIREAKVPNDFYNIYKLKGVESINKHLLEVIGETAQERAIERKIKEGNLSQT